MANSLINEDGLLNASESVLDEIAAYPPEDVSLESDEECGEPQNAQRERSTDPHRRCQHKSPPKFLQRKRRANKGNLAC